MHKILFYNKFISVLVYEAYNTLIIKYDFVHYVG